MDDSSIVWRHLAIPGAMMMWPSTTPPTGWLICNGASVLRASYPALFAIIGTAFGSVDGTHFTLPDMRGRVPAGLDATQGEVNAMGKTGGEKYHTIATTELPAHNHTASVPNHNHSISDPGHNHNVSDPGHAHLETVSDNNGWTGTDGQVGGVGVLGANHNSSNSTVASVSGISVGSRTTGISVSSASLSITVANTGGGGSANVMQPYQVISFIIKT